MTDARATVDVLHGLIERVGNLGVHTIEDLQEFARRVSPQRRAKRTWAAALPERPGVYLFVAEHDGQRHVLYVGKSKNIRRRVRSYFTAAETRPRMDEMVRMSTGVEAIPCQTALQAEVVELRLIGSHAPRYNRRSKFPERTQWIKITDEPFPRLSLVRSVRDDGATYFGPFQRRQSCRGRAARHLRRVPDPPVHPAAQRHDMINACALAGMGRCCAPCDGTVSARRYAEVVDRVRRALSEDVRPAVSGVQARLTRLVDPAALRGGGDHPPAAGDAEPVPATGSIGSAASRRCPEIVAARKDRRRLGDPRHPARPPGRRRRGQPDDVPQAVARAVRPPPRPS